MSTMTTQRPGFRPGIAVGTRPAAPPQTVASSTVVESGEALPSREEILKILEEARGRYAKMRDAGIRWEGDVERHSKEEADGRKEGMLQFNTGEPDELREISQKSHALLVQQVLAFVNQVGEVAERLNVIAGGAAV